MPSDRYYWDSCVFLDLIEATPGRIGNIRPYLEGAEKKRLEIVTSTFTVAEVAYSGAERSNQATDPATLRSKERMCVARQVIRDMSRDMSRIW